MKAAWVMALAFAALCVAPGVRARPRPALEIRFCPTSQLRPYPLDAQGRMQGLLLDGFTVVNRGDAPVRIDEIDISLLDQGRVVDRRVLDKATIAKWAGNGPPLQEAMKVAPFEFCSADIVPPGVTLGGPRLQRNQGLIVVNEVFAYDRNRDAVRVEAHGDAAGRAVSASAAIPIKRGFAATRFAFPLKGVWYVGWGPSFHTGHRAHTPEAFALDIGKLGAEASTHRGDGLRFEDYYAYGAEVLAAADGRVARVQDGRPEDPSAIQRPGETADAYAARHGAEAAKGMGAVGENWAAGNYVILDHGDGEYSLYAHLQPGSVRVKVGERVSAGDTLGKLGSSGNSTEPHLHFQVCDRPDPLLCAGIPVAFSNVDILWADGPRAIQSGDIITTRALR